MFIPRLRLWTPLAITLALAATPAAAQPAAVPLTNPSFDDVDLVGTTGQTVLPIVAGWTETGPTDTVSDPTFGNFEGTLNTGVFVNLTEAQGGNPDDLITNADGTQLAFMGASNSASPGISIYQFASQVYQPGQQYTLTVAVGESNNQPLFNYNPNLPPPDPAPAPPRLGLQLVYDTGNEIVVVQQYEAEDVIGVSADVVQFNEMVDLSFTTNPVQAGDAWAGQPIGVRILPLEGVSGNWNLDDVRLTQIPEPGTALLLAPSLLLILRRRWRQRAGTTRPGRGRGYGSLRAQR